MENESEAHNRHPGGISKSNKLTNAEETRK